MIDLLLYNEAWDPLVKWEGAWCQPHTFGFESATLNEEGKNEYLFQFKYLTWCQHGAKNKLHFTVTPENGEEIKGYVNLAQTKASSVVHNYMYWPHINTPWVPCPKLFRSFWVLFKFQNAYAMVLPYKVFIGFESKESRRFQSRLLDPIRST